jgi:CII-binding regulator of phage lambda lysogenization HflD
MGILDEAYKLKKAIASENSDNLENLPELMDELDKCMDTLLGEIWLKEGMRETVFKSALMFMQLRESIEKQTDYMKLMENIIEELNYQLTELEEKCNIDTSTALMNPAVEKTDLL